MHATVAQDGEGVEISMSVTLQGGTVITASQPWVGTIDTDGKFTPLESFTAIDLIQAGDCGSPTPTDISGSFKGDEFTLSTTATADCGTITATLVAQKQ